MLEGKASTKAKNKYNSKAYDRVGLVLPKGEKAVIQAYADKKGMSLNALAIEAIKEKMEREA